MLEGCCGDVVVCGSKCLFLETVGFGESLKTASHLHVGAGGLDAGSCVFLTPPPPMEGRLWASSVLGTLSPCLMCIGICVLAYVAGLGFSLRSAFSPAWERDGRGSRLRK